MTTKFENITKYESIGGWDAIVYHFDGLYTITYAGGGGPIVTAPTKEEAAGKFTQAMSLADSIRKLHHFDKHGKFPPLNEKR